MTRRTPFVAPSPREAVVEALAALQSDLTADAVPRGDSRAWKRAAMRVLAERYGAAAQHRISLVLAYTDTDPRTASALSLSGLECHPRVLLALVEAAERAAELRS